MAILSIREKLGGKNMERLPVGLLVRTVEGGMKKHILQLARGLDKKLFKIHLFAPNSILEETYLTNVICLPINISEDMNPSQKIEQMLFLINYLAKERIKILHSHGFLASFMGNLASSLARVPIRLNTYHNLLSHRPYTNSQQKIYYAFNRISCRNVNHIIAVSKAIKRELMQMSKIPEEKISVIYNGIEEKYNIPVAQPSKSPTIAMVGRLTYEKGIDLFLDCVSILYNTEFKPNFWIVGEGPEKNYAKEKTAQLGLTDRVSFLGFRQDVSKILSAVDILVIPSRNEGLSMIALEGMGLNKPIVSFAVGGLPEVIIDGVTGILVEPYNVSLLGESILKLLRDKNLASYMGHNGGIRVKKIFSIREMIEKTEAIYCSYLKSSKHFSEV